MIYNFNLHCYRSHFLLYHRDKHVVVLLTPKVCVALLNEHFLGWYTNQICSFLCCHSKHILLNDNVIVCISLESPCVDTCETRRLLRCCSIHNITAFCNMEQMDTYKLCHSVVTMSTQYILEYRHAEFYHLIALASACSLEIWP